MRAAIGFNAADVDDHAIPVHRTLGFLLGNVNVTPETGDRNIWGDECKTIPVDAKASGGELAAGTCRNIAPRFCFNDFAPRGQALKLGLDLSAGEPGARELPQQLFQSRAAMRELADVVEDQA